jgi:putative heme iron utilization protein
MPSDPAATVLRLLHEARHASLATLEDGGMPHVSLVAVAPDGEGAPLLLLSDLARHTRNLKRDDRVSLLVTDPRGADPMNAPRASFIGRIARAGDQTGEAVRERFLAWHPDARLYADFTDFAFYRLACDEIHLVEGFGRISTLPGTAATLDWSDAEAVRAGEAGIIAHMNADHADAVALYATALLGAQAGDWRMISIDPEGCDLMCDSQVRRLPFPRRAISLAAVREVLVALAKDARN